MASRPWSSMMIGPLYGFASFGVSYLRFNHWRMIGPFHQCIQLKMSVFNDLTVKILDLQSGNGDNFWKKYLDKFLCGKGVHTSLAFTVGSWSPTSWASAVTALHTWLGAASGWRLLGFPSWAGCPLPTSSPSWVQDASSTEAHGAVICKQIFRCSGNLSNTV